MSLDAQMRSVIKELGEIATAIGVVGTRRQKLLELAKLGYDLAEKLRGERPEVKKLRTEIYQRSHDVRTVSPDGRAVRAIRALMHAIEHARNQLQRTGVGDVPESFSLSVGGRSFEVSNTWGYTADEAKAVLTSVERALKRLDELGLRVDQGLSFALDPEWASGSLAFYDHPWSTIALDPNGGSAFTVPMAFGERVWTSRMRSEDREAWSSESAFTSAFGTFLVGDKVSADEWARLTVSVGKLAKSWPERMAR